MLQDPRSPASAPARATVPATVPAPAPATTPGGPVYAVDRAAQRALQSGTLQHSALLHATGIAFNWWGAHGTIWVVALVWLGARLARWHRAAEFGLRGVEAIAVSSAICGIAKALAGRARPFVTPGEPWHWEFSRGWTDARYFSMPSGHSTAAFAFAAATSATLARGGPVRRAIIVILAFLSAILVAFARMYTNYHWLSDVVVGALLGTSTGLLITRWHASHRQSAFDRVLLGGTPEQQSQLPP